MTRKSLWQHIKELVECDKKIITIQEDIQHVKHGLADDQRLTTQHEAALGEKQRLVHTLQKDLKLKELAATELKGQEDRKRTQRDLANDQKIYMALEREIAGLARERAKADEELLKQLYQLDALQKELAQILEQQTDQAKVLQHDIIIKRENLAHLEQKLEQLIALRLTIVPNIQPEWYAQYERMKHSVPDPIAPVINTGCGSCFYNVLHHDMAKLKQGEVMVCRNCYRFIYYNEEEEKMSHQASY